MLIYGRLQAEFMEIKPDGYIHKYGIPIFGNIFVYVSKPINHDYQILWKL